MADRFGVSLAPYIHALFGLIHQKRCRRVLIIGCGGGSLATMLSRTDVELTLLDVDPRAFAIARRYFHLPASVACHVADGARFLRGNSGRSSRRYDAVVLDAFAKGRIPKHFLAGKFLLLVKSRLRPGGIFLANMIVGGEGDPLMVSMAHALSSVWRYRRLLDRKSSSNRNVIVAAGSVRSLQSPRLRMRPAIGARRLHDALAGFFFRPLR